nr:vWA domain-containing protein [Thiocapsa sp. KS1]
MSGVARTSTRRISTAALVAACLAFFLLGINGLTQARVVGLVFDDSSSMSGKFHKASFAAQLVVSALDESDRLFVVRLNGDRGRITEVASKERASYLRDMRVNWQTGGSTPYQPLQRMLEQLVEATPETEDAALLVFTDGAFGDAPPAGLAQDYETLRGRFPGRNFQVFFISLPGESIAVDVRGALLTAFNGSPLAGATEIKRAQEIVPGLRDVVSILVGADPVESGRFVRQDGAKLGFELPFSVRRVVILTSGDQQKAPARWRTSSFTLAQDPPIQFELQMREPDPGEQQRLRARIVHLTPEAPLSPRAAYEIELDQPLRADDRVLFVTGLELDLALFDRNGVPLQPDAAGRLRVRRGEPVQVQAWLTDLVDGQRVPLDLYGTGIKPEFTLNDGLIGREMRFDDQEQRADANAGPYERPGQLSLSVVARIKGVSYLRSRDLILQIEADVDVTPALHGRHLMTCPDCADDRVELMMGSDRQVHDVYAIDAAVPDVPEAARFRLALDRPLPSGVTLVYPDGRPVLEDDRQGLLTIGPKRPTPLLLRYDERYQETRSTRIRLALEPAEEGLRGATALELDLAPTIAVMRLLETGHSLPDQSAPFSRAVTQVGDGNGIYVSAEGLRAPLSAEHISVESLTGLPAELQVVDDRRILVLPRKRWWCDCLTPSGPQTVRIAYDNPHSRQTDRLEVPIDIRPVVWWQRCWQEIALLLATLLLLLKLYCLWRTQHFPRNSQVWRCEIDSISVPKRRRLHRPWRRLLSLTCSDERCVEYGLVLVARASGIALLRGSSFSDGTFRTRTGEPLRETFEANPKRRDINLVWNDELRDEQNGYRYLFVSDSEKQQNRGCD